ncbi:pyridoxine 5'-phosphate synthase [Escherichia coli]
MDADEEQIKAAAEVGAPFLEIHTGCYADAKTGKAGASWRVCAEDRDLCLACSV